MESVARKGEDMREYTKMHELKAVTCNQCGKRVEADENGILKEEMCSVHRRWGYFSGKDGECHEFDLCESCYDRLTAGFEVAVTVEPETEYV